MLPPYLNDATLDQLIRRALDEDLGPAPRDATTEATVAGDRPARARTQAKEGGVVAGLGLATRVFQAVDPEIKADWAVEDGASVTAGQDLGIVTGRARSLLVAERTALNFLQRMSGIATATRRMVEAARPHGTQILDTRKTAPGLRLVDKWAVHLGGGANHRLGLYDQILIKDNHITAAGGVAQALEAATAYKERAEEPLLVEIETRTLDEVRTALETGGADMLLLDNMTHSGADGAVDTTLLEEALALIDGRARTEASGNVTLETVAAIAATGVDAISSGSLTHSVRALDLSMEIELPEAA